MVSSLLGIFGRNGDDPLQDAKAIGAWLDAQPVNDDLGLQEEMIRLLEDHGARQTRPTPARAQAMLELDRRSVPTQGRLLSQYLHPALSDPIRQRLWHANDDLARWFA